MDSLNQPAILQQFLSLGNDLTDQDYTAAKQNIYKNNFSNTLASEKYRVKLQNSNPDYINASFVLDYIATQQPNGHTIPDFWKMIYQNKCPIVINLTDNTNYLDFEDKQNYGNIIVSISDQEVSKGFIKTVLLMEGDVGRLNVFHITFLKWEDFGVPKKKYLVKLLDLVNLVDSKVGQIVVHCRAGVGRTGTFILIHYMLQKFKEGIYLDPIEVVIKMRQARSGMIQGQIQFEFAISVLLDYLNHQPPKNNRRLSRSVDKIKPKGINKTHKRNLRGSCGSPKRAVVLKEIEI
jgi:protein tyrosine phosphatase